MANEICRNYRQANFKTMKRNYLMFHIMDPELAIDDLTELHRQKETSKQDAK